MNVVTISAQTKWKFSFSPLGGDFLTLGNNITEEKLAEATSTNASLKSQLENMRPQLMSLERALATTRANLEKELSLRRHAELKQDEAETKARVAEGTIASIREDCDSLHEDVAFKEVEFEELKIEFEEERERYGKEIVEERERHRQELQKLQHDIQLLKHEKEEFEDQSRVDCEHKKKLEKDQSLMKIELMECKQQLTEKEEILEKFGKIMKDTIESTLKEIKESLSASVGCTKVSLADGTNEQHLTNAEEGSSENTQMPLRMECDTELCSEEIIEPRAIAEDEGNTTEAVAFQLTEQVIPTVETGITHILAEYEKIQKEKTRLEMMLPENVHERPFPTSLDSININDKGSRISSETNKRTKRRRVLSLGSQSLRSLFRGRSRHQLPHKVH